YVDRDASPAAPKFNMISKPNGWSQLVARSARALGDGVLSDVGMLQRKLMKVLKFRPFPVRALPPLHACAEPATIVRTMAALTRVVRICLSIIRQRRRSLVTSQACDARSWQDRPARSVAQHSFGRI